MSGHRDIGSGVVMRMSGLQAVISMSATAIIGFPTIGINEGRIGTMNRATGYVEPRLPHSNLRVGLISDTHGLLRPEARAFLMGCDYIIHGGDVGGAEILEELAAVAPLIAVRGNNDTAPWARRLRETELIRVGNAFVYVIHNLAQIDIDPRAAGVSVVVSGHSHKPKVEERDGITYINPGSCGPRRFNLPVSVGEIIVSGNTVSAGTLELIGAAERGLPSSPRAAWISRAAGATRSD
jgi:uncharacterized protein